MSWTGDDGEGLVEETLQSDSHNEPVWLRDREEWNHEDVADNQAFPVVAEAVEAKPVERLGPMSTSWSAMRISNPLISVLMIICVLSKLADLDFFDKFASYVLCLYILVFAIILLWFEASGTTLTGFSTRVLSRNCGFMYTIPGRLLFMVFAGVLVCSLRSTFAYIVGALVISNAVFNSWVLLVNPKRTAEMMKRHADLQQHPTEDSTTTADAEVVV